MRLAIVSSAGKQRGEVFAWMLANEKLRSTAHGKRILGGLASQIGAANQADALAALVKALDELPASDAALGKDLMKQLMSKLPPAGRTRIQQAGKAGALFKELLASARLVASDKKKPATERAAAARTLSLADFKEVQPILAELLTFRQPEAVQRAALEALARFDQPKVPALVLAAWPGLSPKVRATAAETLFARPAWTLALLDAVERGKIKTGEIDPRASRSCRRAPIRRSAAGRQRCSRRTSCRSGRM